MPPPSPPASHLAGLHAWDWAVIAVYLGSLLALGIVQSRRQRDAKDYFIMARRHLPPVVIGISLYVTLFSTISFLGKPGEMINKGPMLLLAQIAAVPFSYVIVTRWIIPPLMRQRVTSAFELLEARLGKEIRLLAAVMYLGLRLVWMALLIHIAAKALAVIVGAGPAWVPLIAAVTGLVAATYASVGGLRTVVLADVLQFSIFICSAFITIAIVSRRLHGFGWWPGEWSPYWDRQPWFSFDPHVRVSVFSATLSWLFFRCATAGGDQGSIQRFMATKDEAAARRSYAMNCWATVLITLVLAILGLALLGFFSSVPGALGPGLSVARNGDDLFPYFISHHLPIGVTGLVVSAVVAAAFSSVDSGINSFTAVYKRDILDRFGRHSAPAAGQDIRHARWTAFVIGLAVIGLSLFAQYVTGNILEMTVKLGTIVAAPNFSLFILALWVPWATPLGALAGCGYGVVTASLFCFWDRWTGHPPLSFQWEGPLALAVALAVAMGVSRWGPRRENLRASVWAAAAAGLVLALATTVLIRRA